MTDLFISPRDRGDAHCSALVALKEGRSGFGILPLPVVAMLSPGEDGRPQWQHFIIPVTGREVRHASVLDWIQTPPSAGLGVQLAFLVDVLRRTERKAVGAECLVLLDSQLRSEGHAGIAGTLPQLTDLWTQATPAERDAFLISVMTE